jgi:hypothetical protein
MVTLLLTSGSASRGTSTSGTSTIKLAHQLTGPLH